jgi:hypothetical protein
VHTIITGQMCLLNKIIVYLFFIPALLSAQIPKDKQLHMYAGATIGAWGTLTVPDKGVQKEVIGVAWATIAGLGKETVDGFGFGTPDIKDVGYTVIGAVVSVTVIRGVKEIVKVVKKHKRYERNNKH